MTTTALYRPPFSTAPALDARAFEAMIPRRGWNLLRGGLRRKRPTLFQKCLAVHIANLRMPSASR